MTLYKNSVKLKYAIEDTLIVYLGASSAFDFLKRDRVTKTELVHGSINFLSEYNIDVVSIDVGQEWVTNSWTAGPRLPKFYLNYSIGIENKKDSFVYCILGRKRLENVLTKELKERGLIL